MVRARVRRPGSGGPGNGWFFRGGGKKRDARSVGDCANLQRREQVAVRRQSALRYNSQTHHPNAPPHAPSLSKQGASGLVDATSQVSRFHTETLESTTVKGLDLHGVQLAVDGRGLLEDAHLQLCPGRRYGLIGR